MPDYAEMYRLLFSSQTKAIEILQEAQRATEELYMSSEPPDLVLLDTRKTDDDTDDEQ